jgi:anti-sigma factor RsiW
VDADDLLDYALGRLEGPRRERFDRLLAGDPALAERVARLIHMLDQLLDDGREDRGSARSELPLSDSP